MVKDCIRNDAACKEPLEKQCLCFKDNCNGFLRGCQRANKMKQLEEAKKNKQTPKPTIKPEEPSPGHEVVKVTASPEPDASTTGNK